VPVVVLPLGRDQLDNAARVQHHGAGVRLKPKAKPEAIAAAVRRVLDEPSYRVAAERLAAAIAAETARDQAAEELEGLAGRSRNGSVPVLEQTL
jgi:UDP:flavonoid glycosyltransferase YjiC (YdhE family)